MIIKKLAVPFVNEKLLSQAEHIYMATAALSEPGFDFVVSRLSLKCKLEIVTGLHVPSEPRLLRRILKHFPDRVQLHVYTKNKFHANAYILDLPYRKSVAFIGSGTFTAGGIKDNDEIFYKVKDPKEIEELKSWFTGYYEFAEPLSATMIDEYEWIYPSIRQRQIASQQETMDVLLTTTRGFNWDTFKFKNQYFTKDDYLVFGNSKASLNTPEIRANRITVQNKFLHLHALLQEHLSVLRLYEDHEKAHIVSSLNPLDHPDHKVRAMWIGYGRSKEQLASYDATARHDDFMRLLVIIRPMEAGIWLVAGKENAGRIDREYFQLKMKEVEYRTEFFRLLRNLHPELENNLNRKADYWIQVAGERRPVNSFLKEESLWEFIRYDEWQYYDFIIGKDFSPGSPDISRDRIASTVMHEFDRLVLLFRHMQHRNEV